jgi:hypothetical protein
MTTTTLYQDLRKFPDCNSDISTEGTKKFAILPHKGSSSDNLNNTTIQKTRPKVHFAKIILKMVIVLMVISANSGN